MFYPRDAEKEAPRTPEDTRKVNDDIPSEETTSFTGKDLQIEQDIPVSTLEAHPKNSSGVAGMGRIVVSNDVVSFSIAKIKGEDYEEETKPSKRILNGTSKAEAKRVFYEDKIQGTGRTALKLNDEAIDDPKASDEENLKGTN